MNESFRGLLIEKNKGLIKASVKSLKNEQLPSGDTIVNVSYSSLNYKDGMILEGMGRIVRHYPHIPGIDFVGEVETTVSNKFNSGDKVILTGWRVGETRWGGFSEKVCVQADWLIPLPENMTFQNAMVVGTAGLTAMLALMALEDKGVHPDQGPVLVTGANGGVGGLAIALLKANGYQVHASTGRPQLAQRLRSLGADEIINRAELNIKAERPLQTETWAGAIDTVGGNSLANILGHIKYGGSVACCGLASGSAFHTTVIPFLLRAVNLLGIDSVMCSTAKRLQAWKRIEKDLSNSAFKTLINMISLDDIPKYSKEILRGRTAGRIVVDINV